ncbi:unnamed protein product [Brassica napus]|uniref:(rape) hypothetical protein n=1 Tax=Brassica napus TaxID=3708 RepID=A0A816YBE7_BRANA|nr:unnamed protein product [Brassica napus]
MCSFYVANLILHSQAFNQPNRNLGVVCSAYLLRQRSSGLSILNPDPSKLSREVKKGDTIFVGQYLFTDKADAQEGEMVGKEPEVEKKREPEPEFEKQKEKKHTTLKEKEMENTAYKDFETAINKRDTETGRGEAFKEGGC